MVFRFYGRQIVLDARFYVLGAELDIVRMKRTASAEKIDELVALIDWICDEHKELWLADNFENGLEKSMGILRRHREELLALPRE